MNLEQLSRALSPIWDAIRSTFSRAVVRNSDSAAGLQTLQVDLGNGDLRDKVEHWEPYGITARPLEGAEAIVLFPGGRSQPGAVLCVGDRNYRIAGLDRGELALYTDEGVAIKLGRNRAIEITGGVVSIVADAVEIEASGSIDITAGTDITLTAPAINLNS